MQGLLYFEIVYTVGLKKKNIYSQSKEAVLGVVDFFVINRLEE